MKEREKGGGNMYKVIAILSLEYTHRMFMNAGVRMPRFITVHAIMILHYFHYEYPFYPFLLTLA